MAVLAIPFLVIDSSSTAEGVVESGAPSDIRRALPTEEPELDLADAAVAEPAPAPPTVFVRPDVSRLAKRAASWTVARREAIADGSFVPTVVEPPSNTDLALLPVVQLASIELAQPVGAADESPVEGEDPPTTAAADTPPAAPEPEPDPEPEPEAETPPQPADPQPEPDPAPDDPQPEPDPEPEPDPQPVPEPEPVDESAEVPEPPARVDGRVPPPAGGPSAAQWNALRRCESTHNYQAVSSTGLYRGAYQFSQQTWDWVASIHYPFLVGIDPVDAAPGWQDVMAYTLYAMRGWDQWPVCGKHLL